MPIGHAVSCLPAIVIDDLFDAAIVPQMRKANCLITSSQACVYQACGKFVVYDAIGSHYLSLYRKILEANNLPITAKRIMLKPLAFTLRIYGVRGV